MRIEPTDDDFDDMHHALGRPKDPQAQPYRNHFVVDLDSDTARRFAALGLWRLTRRINGGRDGVFSVTEEGVALTMKWAARQQRERGERRFLVTSPQGACMTVLAKSRHAAIYAVFLDLTDVWNCSFRDFLRHGFKARLA